MNTKLETLIANLENCEDNSIEETIAYLRQQAQPVAWMKVSTYITPDSPNGPAEYDQEVELVLDGELASYEGYIPLFTSPPAPQADQQAQLYRATVIEECRQTIIDLRLPDCEWEKKYNDRFDDGVKAAIHQLNELLKPVEEVERYDCPIHGLQDGPDCARC